MAELLGNEQRITDQLSSQAAILRSLADDVLRIIAQSKIDSPVPSKQTFPGTIPMTLSMAPALQPITIRQYTSPPLPSAPSFPAPSQLRPFGLTFSAQQQSGMVPRQAHQQQPLNLPGSTQFLVITPSPVHSSTLPFQRLSPQEPLTSNQSICLDVSAPSYLQNNLAWSSQ
jgi:hypothetical protein